MKIHLHDALKDPSMKYPRAANRLLDTGMSMMVVGAVAVSAVLLGMLRDETYFWLSMTVFVAGFISFSASKFVAGLKANETDGNAASGQRLKLVK